MGSLKIPENSFRASGYFIHASLLLASLAMYGKPTDYQPQ
jgi:hypothetical protein